jgi:hypothetical protein
MPNPTASHSHPYRLSGRRAAMRPPSSGAPTKFSRSAACRCQGSAAGVAGDGRSAAPTARPPAGPAPARTATRPTLRSRVSTAGRPWLTATRRLPPSTPPQKQGGLNGSSGSAPMSIPFRAVRFDPWSHGPRRPSRDRYELHHDQAARVHATGSKRSIPLRGDRGDYGRQWHGRSPALRSWLAPGLPHGMGRARSRPAMLAA